MKKRICLLSICLFVFLMNSTVVFALTEDELFAKGEQLFQQGKFEEALQMFEGAAEKDPEDAVNYEWIGACLFRMTVYEEALGAFNKSIELEPHYSPYEYKGVCLYIMGEKEKALEAFNQSIQLYGYANNYLWKAMVLMDAGQFDAAADIYRIVSELSGTVKAEKVLYYNNQGFALYMAKKYSEASEIIEKALLLDPSQPAVYKNKGLILEAEGKYDEAFAAYNYALTLDNQYDKARNAKYSLMARLNGGIDPASMEEWGTTQTGIAIDKVWTIGFNLPVNIEDAASQIVITDQKGNRLPLSITAGSEAGIVQVRLAGGQKYLPGTRYVLYVLGDVKGKYDSQMKNGIFMEFVTKQ